MLHCVIFLRITGKPPRSETPLMISSLASTVPSPGHQLTSVSAKYVNRYCSSICSFRISENEFHCAAVKVSMLSSQTACTFSFPFSSNFMISVQMLSALAVILLYHELNNWIKIHCVHL